MNARLLLSRRRLIAAGLFGLLPGRGLAQGFAGLGGGASGFAEVTPGRALAFPRDHGAHPDYRIEWWYLTANLTSGEGAALGIQWTLFRQAMAPGSGGAQDWSDPQIWMGHAAATSADMHRSAETFARGGIGQAGVERSPFRAWIDAWSIEGEGSDAATLSPLTVRGAGRDFSYALRLASDRHLVLQGDQGYSRKSERGQASYYYSQPFFTADGTVTFGDRTVAVRGRAWMDREWSSQPLASDQTGWDWFSLHLDSGDRLMLFRLRQKDGSHYFAGNWIAAQGRSTAIDPRAIAMTPLASVSVAGRSLPVAWRLTVESAGFAVETSPLNLNAWNATRFPYWEGPIAARGSHGGVGYLEMTGH